MRIVENERGFELHIISSLIDNIVTSQGKRYNYKRLVIPNVLMDYFFSKKNNLVYVYLYFYNESVFLSFEKLPDLKYSQRRLMKLSNKNSYFINLNERSLSKHDISISDTVLFVIGGKNSLLDSDCISIELRF